MEIEQLQNEGVVKLTIIEVNEEFRIDIKAELTFPQ